MELMYIVLLGLALGSFTNALVWRIYKQSSLKGVKKRAKFSIGRGRSMCPECEHVLSGWDLVPVFSWVFLRGKCRYCKKTISVQYPAVELLFAVALVTSYLYWPYTQTNITTVMFVGLWAVLLVLMFAMSIYDIRWQLLPNRLMYPFVLLSAIFVLLLVASGQDFSLILSSVIGATTLGGSFWATYQISDGKWIGGGDVRLATAIGILLGWQKGLLAIVLASYLAVIVVFFIFLMGKYKKKMRIAFGPFLILGTYIVFLFGEQFIDVYKRLSGL